MDRITTALLTEFCREFGTTKLAEETQFEHFATYLAVRRHYSETAFVPADLAMGGGGDTGIDAVAIIVNGNLVLDVDQVQELVDINGFLDVTFVFIQAERSANFDGGKIANLGYGVRDFFGEGRLKRNGEIQTAAEIMKAIYDLSSKFKANPTCYMYYVTTGRWVNDQNLRARITTEENDLKATNLFKHVELFPVGADQIQKLYNETKNKISREFTFAQRTVVPDIANVVEAHLGYLSAKDYLKLVCDEQGAIIKSLFYENVRDWQGYNQINSEIRATLESESKDRFVLMNNGATIIAKSLQTTGHRFTMGDFQVVNGCQTSHILHGNQDLLTDAVRIPLRIICTQNEAVMESIITATNRQTEITQDQFFALRTFAKKLEAYFRSFDEPKRLYYERRTHQYDSQEIEKTRIVVHQNLVRAVGATFLGEPHRTVRTYRLLSARIGKEMFADTDRTEPYYVAALAAYKLEFLFRNKKLDPRFKIGRYQILQAARLLLDSKPLPPMNSNDMGRRCDEMMKTLWDDADSLLLDAVAAVDKVAQGRWDRDHIHREAITDGILGEFGQRKRGAAVPA